MGGGWWGWQPELRLPLHPAQLGHTRPHPVPKVPIKRQGLGWCWGLRQSSRGRQGLLAR